MMLLMVMLLLREKRLFSGDGVLLFRLTGWVNYIR